MLQKGKDVEIDGYKGFIFMAKSGRLLMPNAINNILYNIVDAYNRKEVQVAKTEHRNAELLPKVSAHGRVIIRTSQKTPVNTRGCTNLVLIFNFLKREK